MWPFKPKDSCDHCYHEKKIEEPVLRCCLGTKVVRRTVWECCLCKKQEQACNLRGEPLCSGEDER